MSTCLFGNFFNYILNTFKHFIFLSHSCQLLVHPCSQSTRRRLSKLPFFFSSCPILPRKSVFISSLPSSREKHHPFFPFADTGALGVLLSNLMRLLSSGQGLSPYCKHVVWIESGWSQHWLQCVYAPFIFPKKIFKHSWTFNGGNCLEQAITEMCLFLFSDTVIFPQ